MSNVVDSTGGWRWFVGEGGGGDGCGGEGVRSEHVVYKFALLAIRYNEISIHYKQEWHVAYFLPSLFLCL